MKYTVSRCPTCGGPPVAEFNTVPVFAGLVENEDGGFDYSGDRALGVRSCNHAAPPRVKFQNDRIFFDVRPPRTPIDYSNLLLMVDWCRSSFSRRRN